MSYQRRGPIITTGEKGNRNPSKQNLISHWTDIDDTDDNDSAQVPSDGRLHTGSTTNRFWRL